MTNFDQVAREGFSEKVTAELRREGWEGTSRMKRGSESSPGGATSTYQLDMKCSPSEVCLCEAFNIGGTSALTYCWLCFFIFVNVIMRPTPQAGSSALLAGLI